MMVLHIWSCIYAVLRLPSMYATFAAVLSLLLSAIRNNSTSHHVKIPAAAFLFNPIKIPSGATLTNSAGHSCSNKMLPKPEVVLLILCLGSQLAALASDPDPMQDFCIPNTKLDFHAREACKPSTQITPDDFVFSGIKSPGNFSDAGLSAKLVNPTSFPGLNTLGMSFVRADLHVGGLNAPHFHPRATEIAFVVEGKVYSGFVDSTNRVFAKVIEKGEVMVFPRGLVHFQMNVGHSIATIYGSFNSQNPGMQKIPATIFGSGINDELLEKAFGLTLADIGKMRRKFFPKRKG